jgi:mannose/fructose-specific phosphotransferase system component IIA
MIGIILCTHADFAQGLKNACEMIAGPQESFYACNFDGNEQLLEYAEGIRKVSQEMESCIYVCDLVNATPFNAAMYVAADHNSPVISGASLPLVLELLIKRNGFEGTVEELAKSILPSHASYVSVVMPQEILGGDNHD